MAKHFNKTQRRQIFERDGTTCRLCGNEYSVERLQIDHIKPMSRGGEATLENGIVVCDTCNRLKSTFFGDDLIHKIKWAEERLSFFKLIYFLQNGVEYRG